MKNYVSEWVSRISESYDFDRLLISLGSGFGHAFLGMLAGGFLVTAVGVGLDSINLIPPNIDPVLWIEGGGAVGAVVGFIVGFVDMFERAKV